MPAYPDTREFVDEVLRPFGARFDPADPFRPIRIRAVYNDEAARTAIEALKGFREEPHRRAT